MDTESWDPGLKRSEEGGGGHRETDGRGGEED